MKLYDDATLVKMYFSGVSIASLVKLVAKARRITRRKARSVVEGAVYRYVLKEGFS